MNAIDASKKARELVGAYGRAMYEYAQCGGTLADLEAPVGNVEAARFALYAYIAQLESSAPALCPHDNARGYCAQCAGDKETRATDRTLYGTEIVDPGRRDK